MKDYEIEVYSEGINLFDIAVASKYFLTDARTTINLKRNYGLSNPG